MNLLIDIGNSRLKWAIETDGELSIGPAAFVSDEPLEVKLDELWGSLQRPKKIIISNVAGQFVQEQIDQWLNNRWGTKGVTIKSQQFAFDVTCGYLNPETLGTDRWACLIAAKRYYPLPACIVSCGTAITADVIDSSGIHEGGAIIPGLRLMQQSLIDHTWGIQQNNAGTGIDLGRTTAEGIAYGSLLAVRGMISQIVQLVLDKHGRSPTLVLTGGDAQRVASGLNERYLIVPDLLLQGLVAWL